MGEAIPPLGYRLGIKEQRAMQTKFYLIIERNEDGIPSITEVTDKLLYARELAKTLARDGEGGEHDENAQGHMYVLECLGTLVTSD